MKHDYQACDGSICATDPHTWTETIKGRDEG